jgi:hypothetical protein
MSAFHKSEKPAGNQAECRESDIAHSLQRWNRHAELATARESEQEGKERGSGRHLFDLQRTGSHTLEEPLGPVPSPDCSFSRIQIRQYLRPGQYLVEKMAQCSRWASPTKPDNLYAASWLSKDSSNSIGDMYAMELWSRSLLYQMSHSKTAFLASSRVEKCVS